MIGRWIVYQRTLWHFLKDGQQKALCGVSCAVEPVTSTLTMPPNLGRICWKCRYIHEKAEGKKPR